MLYVARCKKNKNKTHTHTLPSFLLDSHGSKRDILFISVPNFPSVKRNGRFYFWRVSFHASFLGFVHHPCFPYSIFHFYIFLFLCSDDFFRSVSFFFYARACVDVTVLVFSPNLPHSHMKQKEIQPILPVDALRVPLPFCSIPFSGVFHYRRPWGGTQLRFYKCCPAASSTLNDRSLDSYLLFICVCVCVCGHGFSLLWNAFFSHVLLIIILLP